MYTDARAAPNETGSAAALPDGACLNCGKGRTSGPARGDRHDRRAARTDQRSLPDARRPRLPARPHVRRAGRSLDDGRRRRSGSSRPALRDDRRRVHVGAPLQRAPLHRRVGIDDRLRRRRPPAAARRDAGRIRAAPPRRLDPVDRRRDRSTDRRDAPRDDWIAGSLSARARVGAADRRARAVRCGVGRPGRRAGRDPRTGDDVRRATCAPPASASTPLHAPQPGAPRVARCRPHHLRRDRTAPARPAATSGRMCSTR